MILTRGSIVHYRHNYIRVIFGCTLLSVILFASSCTSPASQVNSGSDGIAIKGYDPVAYFTLGKPVKGDKEFTYQWNGASWLFASKDHIDLFSSSPEKYAPQYGGY